MRIYGGGPRRSQSFLRPIIRRKLPILVRGYSDNLIVVVGEREIGKIRVLGGNQLKVFISHSIKDLAIVEEFKKLVESVGVEAYLAVYDIQPGKDLWEKFETNIKNSNLVLAILTETGATSEILNQEIGVAKASNILVVPIAEEKANLKGLLQKLEYIKLDKDHLDLAKEAAYTYLNKLKKEEENRELIGFIVVGIILIILLAWSGSS